MIRRSRDAKFVIYQVLYIFIITVLALKGAEINLGEVVDKEEVVEKSVRDSLISVVDSLTELGINFDIQISPDVIEENKELKEKLSSLNTQVASLSKRVIENKKSPKPKPEIEIKKETNLPSPFSENITFLKYATNEVENRSNNPVTIIDPNNNKLLGRVGANQKTTFELENQDEVIVQYGNQSEKIKVKENLPPEISIERVTNKMDKSDIYVRDLQRTTCFVVKIKDERLEQIKVTHNGPISVNGPQKDKKGNIVYNVSLNLAANDERFEEWADRNEHLLDADDRYKATFFFIARDTKSNQKVQIGENFYFTEFSK